MRRLAVYCLLLFAVAVCGQPRQPHHAPDGARRIRTGAERMEVYLPLLQGHSVAVVANQSSLVGSRHLVDTLLACGIEIKMIFCPEHGFRGTAAAGEHVADGTDPATGLPLISLYGKNKKPPVAKLQEVDIVLFDLQDVGCRFYTYLSTLHYVMQACGEARRTLLLLDRPNPNASYVDGPCMEPSCTSFVGLHAGVPIVYGMTIGEYGRMIEGEHWASDTALCDLRVVALENYTHDSTYLLPVPPSPNLRTPQAIALYPSLCLLEGTTISLGRGTDYPFEVVGNDYKLDLRKVKVAQRVDLSYLLDLYAHTPQGTFFLKSNFFEKLAGTTALRRQIEQGLTEEQIRQSWQAGLDAFRQTRARYLIYQ